MIHFLPRGVSASSNGFVCKSPQLPRQCGVSDNSGSSEAGACLGLEGHFLSWHQEGIEPRQMIQLDDLVLYNILPFDFLCPSVAPNMQETRISVWVSFSGERLSSTSEPVYAV